MAFLEGVQFQLYVTHVEGEGPNLKVFGQIDKPRALMIESMLSGSKANLDSGLNQVSPSNIQLGMLCIAKYGDGDYYRARVTSINDIASGMVSVYFIDYGNNDVVHVGCIRVFNNFPEVFQQVAPQAKDFILARIAHPKGVWDSTMQSYLNKLIYYNEISCVVEMTAFEKVFIKMIYEGQDFADFLTCSNFGVKTTLQDQRDLLHKVLNSTKNSHYEGNRMYIPPPARLVLGDVSNSREAYRGYVPPQSQTTGDMGRTIGKYPQTGRAKVRTVIPPRPLHRSMEDPQPSQMAELQRGEAAASLSPTPTTYHSRHLKENESYLVHVSYAKDGPKCFAIQLKSDEEFLSNIVSSINNVPPQKLTGPPMIGSVCLGRFSEDKTLCRAVVLSSTESYCKLFFVDFGITENVLFSDIFQISESDIRPHVFALRFSLSGIAKMQVSEKIKNDFYNIVNNQVLTLKVVPPEGPPLIQYCELYLNGQCVKEMLLQKQNPTFRKIDSSVISGDHLVLVSYVDSCTKFFIQLSKHIDALNDVMDQVAAHCQQAQPLLYHQVRCGMSCCALFPDDQGWYRGLITNIKKDKITVNYVDYGNEQELTCDLLRAITPELTVLNAQAVHCALRGFEDKPFDQRTCDSLEKLTLEKILSMKVHGVMEGGVLLVDLLDESTTPATFIASAVLDAAMSIPPAALAQKSSPQDLFDADVATPSYGNTEYVDAGRDNNSDQSFGSNKGYGDSGNFKSKKQFQDRNRNDRGGGGGGGRGNHEDKKWDNEENSCKKQLKGGQSEAHHTSSDPNKCPSKQNKKMFAENPWRGGPRHPRDTKSDWSNKPYNKGDRGRKFSDRSNDKEYNAEKRSYGDDRSNKPFKSRNYDNQDSYGESKPYKARSYDNQESYGESKPYKSRNYDNQDSYGESKPYKARSYDNQDSYGESKPYKSRSYEPQEPPKTLQNPVSSDTPFIEPEIVMGQECPVRVSWFINPNDFFVNLISEEEAFKSMMFNVPTMYAGVKPAFSYEVTIGSSVLARFPQDKALYRAHVLDCQYGGKVKVQFVDYGNKCMVDGTDVWQLESDLIALPKMAIHCSLKGISPLNEKWKQDINVDSCFSSDSYTMVVHSKDNDRYNVSLVGEAGDVGKLLIERQLAVSTEENTSQGARTKVFITHVDTPGQFWLQCESDSEQIDSLQDTLQSAGAYDDFTDIEVGKLCISKYSADDQYYRTVILDSDNDIITVRFIDYGNTDVLDNVAGALKCLPSEMQSVEAYALKCSVNAVPTGTGQWTEQASTAFTNLLGSMEEAVDAVFVLKGATTYVDLFVNAINVTDQLVLEGHAARAEKSDQTPTCFASHVNSPSEFWIQLESSVHDLEAIAEELVNAEDFPPLNEIAEEVICAAKFPEDDLWYRAQVIIHGSDGTEVLFMDYGNASLTNELRSLPDHLKSLPALSRKCALQKSANIKTWSKEAELKFAELAADGATVFQVAFIASGDTSIVELYAEGESVTKQLSDLCQTENPTPATSPVRLATVGSEDKTLYVHVCHSNSPEDFWIHYASSTDALNCINEALENAGDLKRIDEEITEGMICASIFSEDNLYYRSKVMSHGDGGTEVFHIDFGSTALTDDLRELPTEIQEMTPLAVHCTLEMPHDRSKINEEMHNKFAELVVNENTQYVMEIINKDCDPNVVRLFVNNENVTELLGYKFQSDNVSVPAADAVVDDLPSAGDLKSDSDNADTQQIQVNLSKSEPDGAHASAEVDKPTKIETLETNTVEYIEVSSSQVVESSETETAAHVSHQQVDNLLMDDREATLDVIADIEPTEKTQSPSDDAQQDVGEFTEDQEQLMETCQDEDTYSDISNSSQPLDPDEEIQACLDASDNLVEQDTSKNSNEASSNKSLRAEGNLADELQACLDASDKVVESDTSKDSSGMNDSNEASPTKSVSPQAQEKSVEENKVCLDSSGKSVEQDTSKNSSGIKEDMSPNKSTSSLSDAPSGGNQEAVSHSDLQNNIETNSPKIKGLIISGDVDCKTVTEDSNKNAAIDTVCEALESNAESEMDKVEGLNGLENNNTSVKE